MNWDWLLSFQSEGKGVFGARIYIRQPVGGVDVKVIMDLIVNILRIRYKNNIINSLLKYK